MMTGPTMSETATILAAVVALAAFPVAWFAYIGEERRSRERRYRGVENVIAGLRPEMEIVERWTRGPNGAGYPTTGNEIEDYRLYSSRPEFVEWKSPTRALRPFACPVIAQLSLSEYVSELGPLLRPFVLLNFSIAALDKAERERGNFAMGDPVFLARMVSVYLEEGTKPSPEQEEFLEMLFLLNFDIHVRLIGSAQSEDTNCLHRAYHAARRTLDGFATTWTQSASRGRRWERIVDGVALASVVGAVGLFLAWLLWALEPFPRLILCGIARML